MNISTKIADLVGETGRLETFLLKVSNQMRENGWRIVLLDEEGNFKPILLKNYGHKSRKEFDAEIFEVIRNLLNAVSNV